MTEVGNFIYLIAAATMQALAMALFKIASGNDGRAVILAGVVVVISSGEEKNMSR